MSRGEMTHTAEITEHHCRHALAIDDNASCSRNVSQTDGMEV